MNFNQLFYKPKRVSRESIIELRKKYLAFLTAVLMISSLSGDTSKDKFNNEDNVKNDEMLFKLVSYSALAPDDIDLKLKHKREVVKIVEEVQEVSVDEEIIEESIEKRIKDIPIMVDEAQFARNIREILKDIPNEVKYNYIIEHFRHTPYEFDVIQATIQGEAKPEDKNEGRYVDAFACINGVYSRMASKTKCGYARIWLGKEGYITMYDHIIAPGQYQPYGDGDYKAYLGVHSGEAYQAVLDFLYIADKDYGYMHNNLDFMASGLGYEDSVAYVTGGNEFRNPLTMKDTIPLEERYYMIADETLEENPDEILDQNGDTLTTEGIIALESSELMQDGEIFESEFTPIIEEEIPSEVVIQDPVLNESDLNNIENEDNFSLSLHR